jgi:hypothetical protein
VGAWLSLLSTTVNGTELSAQEFHYALYMRYGIAPPDLPESCDGCEGCFTLQHALAARKVDLSCFVTTKFQMSWYTWLEKHSPLQQYATNP